MHERHTLWRRPKTSCTMPWLQLTTGRYPPARLMWPPSKMQFLAVSISSGWPQSSHAGAPVLLRRHEKLQAAGHPAPPGRLVVRVPVRKNVPYVLFENQSAGEEVVPQGIRD